MPRRPKWWPPKAPKPETRILLMHEQHTTRPGERCKTCIHLDRRHYTASLVFKCLESLVTHTPETDWRAHWPACGLWQLAPDREEEHLADMAHAPEDPKQVATHTPSPEPGPQEVPADRRPRVPSGRTVHPERKEPLRLPPIRRDDAGGGSAAATASRGLRMLPGRAENERIAGNCQVDGCSARAEVRFCGIRMCDAHYRRSLELFSARARKNREEQACHSSKD